MMDKIKAEADAIPCGKDEKIKALEALLKLALKERDEALAYAERLRDSIEALMASSDGVAGLHLNGEIASWGEITEGGRFDEWLLALSEQPPSALAALKAEWQAEALKEIARIAHHGGLIGFSSDADAMIEIRRLTIGAWDKRAQEAGE